MTLTGALYMGAMLFYLRAIQSAEASVVAPLFQLSVIFTTLLAYLLLDETLAPLQLVGIGLIVAGALTASVHPRAFLHTFKAQLLGLMIAATFIMALGSVAFKYFALENASYWGTTFWTFVGEALFGAAILAVPGRWRQFITLLRRNPGAVLGVNAANEVINLGGGLAVRYASLLAPVGLVSAISSTTTLFVFGFGILLTLLSQIRLRGSIAAQRRAKGAAAVLAAAGVLLANT